MEKVPLYNNTAVTPRPGPQGLGGFGLGSFFNSLFSNLWGIMKTVVVCATLVAIAYGVWTAITNPKRFKVMIKSMKSMATGDPNYATISNQDYTDGDCGDELEEDTAGGGMFEVPENKNYRDV
jgi:hypothetical protein